MLIKAMRGSNSGLECENQNWCPSPTHTCCYKCSKEKRWTAHIFFLFEDQDFFFSGRMQWNGFPKPFRRNVEELLFQSIPCVPSLESSSTYFPETKPWWGGLKTDYHGHQSALAKQTALEWGGIESHYLPEVKSVI